MDSVNSREVKQTVGAETRPGESHRLGVRGHMTRPGHLVGPSLAGGRSSCLRESHAGCSRPTRRRRPGEGGVPPPAPGRGGVRNVAALSRTPAECQRLLLWVCRSQGSKTSCSLFSGESSITATSRTVGGWGGRRWVRLRTLAARLQPLCISVL